MVGMVGIDSNGHVSIPESVLGESRYSDVPVNRGRLSLEHLKWEKLVILQYHTKYSLDPFITIPNVFAQKSRPHTMYTHHLEMNTILNK